MNMNVKQVGDELILAVGKRIERAVAPTNERLAALERRLAELEDFVLEHLASSALERPTTE